MQRMPVESSTVKSVGYDLLSETLEIEFKGKNLYEYFDVPQDVYIELVGSQSIGKFVNSKLNKIYKSRKVDSNYATFTDDDDVD